MICGGPKFENLAALAFLAFSSILLTPIGVWKLHVGKAMSESETCRLTNHGFISVPMIQFVKPLVCKNCEFDCCIHCASHAFVVPGRETTAHNSDTKDKIVQTLHQRLLQIRGPTLSCGCLITCIALQLAPAQGMSFHCQCNFDQGMFAQLLLIV